jgi:hypothetical protein
VDPGQRDGRELELVREDRPVTLEQIDDQVDPGGGVRDEGDLPRLRTDETGDLLPYRLAPAHPGVPMTVATLLVLAIEGAHRFSHRPGDQRRGGGIQVDLAGEAGEVGADLLPRGRHDGRGYPSRCV